MVFNNVNSVCGMREMLRVLCVLSTVPGGAVGGRGCRASFSPTSAALTLLPLLHLGRRAWPGRGLARVQSQACRNVEGSVALMVTKGGSRPPSTPRAPIRNMTRLLTVHSSTSKCWHRWERRQMGRQRGIHSCRNNQMLPVHAIHLRRREEEAAGTFLWLMKIIRRRQKS